MWDDAVDGAIDDVARAMTAGEPHGDLRARVMARIVDVSDARLKRSRSIWRGALAAMAIVLVALVAYRETRPLAPARPLNPDTTTAVRRPGPVAPGEPPVAAPADSQRPAPHLNPTARAPRRLVTPPSPIDALAPPPLDIAPLAVDDLDAQPLTLQPLDTIAPIAVAPLGQGDRP